MKHHSVASEVAHIKAQAKSMTAEEIRELYDIEIRKDGSVYDFAFDQEFADLIEWVDFNQGSEDDEPDYKHGYDSDEDF